MQTFSVDIEHYSLDVVRQGSGQPLLLIHGSVSDSRTWKKHIETLSKTFDVITPTLRYFGAKPWPDDGKEFGTQRHALDILQLVEHLGLNNITSVGWSYGGNVAIHAALLKPDAFKNIFLYEPATASLLRDETKLELAVADRVAMFSRTAKLLKTHHPRDAVETFLDDAAGQQGAFLAMPEYAREASLDNAATLNLRMAMTPPDLSLEAFSVPTLIACGESTRDFYRITAEGLQQQCKSIAVKWIPGANHLWPLLNLEDFCQEIEHFT